MGLIDYSGVRTISPGDRRAGPGAYTAFPDSADASGLRQRAQQQASSASLFV